MVQMNKGTLISWAQFEICNPNVKEAFESMCRWIFNEQFFDGKALLHSDPNNPGVEVHPYLHSESGERISFQAKHFSNNIDYVQISRSVDKIIEHYAGQIDTVYLYCNKDVTTTSNQYKDIAAKLVAEKIKLIPITNEAILEQVRKNPIIALQFFNEILLNREWFREKLDNSLDLLGPKYNHSFNVTTKTEELLWYFLCDENAVVEINKRKTDILHKINKEYGGIGEYQSFLPTIIEKLDKLDDITRDNILECLSWDKNIRCLCEDSFHEIKELIEKKEKEVVAINGEKQSLFNEISAGIRRLEYLLNLPQNIIPTSLQQTLLKQQVLIIKGEAGSGKSHLLAVASEKLLEEGNSTLLLLGSYFQNENPIENQIMDIIGINFSIDDFLGKLEGAAVRRNKYSYIFIDALNESSYKKIWKIGLNNLIKKIKKYPHVKVVFSVRNGYEKLVFNDTILKYIDNNNVGHIVHQGFREESVRATFDFLNHYGIPFLPSYFLRSEMTNPLFLTLFCKTFSKSKEVFDIFELFNQLISDVNDEAQKAIGIEDPMNILMDLIYEMVDIRLKNGNFYISRNELLEFDFWRKYGLLEQKIPFIKALEHSKFLISMANENIESYCLGYNLLEDFVCAKVIMRQYPQKECLIKYLQEQLLEIKDGCITNYINIDIFIIICSLYAEQMEEECFFDVISHIIDDDKDDITDRYLKSFLWRKASSIRADLFYDFIKRYHANRDTVFQILIENSTKEQHPLNAIFLHNLLKERSIANRDNLWTTFINHLADDEERIFQLIQYFNKGSMLSGLSNVNTELLLILLIWLLTSSNRHLRDKASKAAIEILKHKFGLCKSLLQRFNTVNDPYVVQRLYGIVFGASVKRVNIQMEVFDELTDYIYDSFFDQEFVYPDILARDYARLILERWLFENPTRAEKYNVEKIRPPYKSAPIPMVEYQKYCDESKFDNGFNLIERSMRLEHKKFQGWYGDFGRYIFQGTLSAFKDVDVLNMYHYAMQYIRDELGYTDDLFGRYDCTYAVLNRHDTKKLERIGKKYQWIALHNILARISDVHMLQDWNDEQYQFEGAWDPYVRDFDPTLNVYSLIVKDAPIIKPPIRHSEFLPQSPSPSTQEISSWIKQVPIFFISIPSKLLITDEAGNSWIALYVHDELKNKEWDSSSDLAVLKKGNQKIWMIADAYFVKKEHIEKLKTLPTSYFAKRENVRLPVYQLFNREYVWSPGYKNVFKEEWIDFEIQTGKEKIILEKMETPIFEEDSDGDISISFEENVVEKKVSLNSKIEILPAYSRFLWEDQYDASQEDIIAFNVPCRSIVEGLNLQQKETDGCYYSEDGTLVCFDGKIAGICNGFLIRKDYIEKYLHEKNMGIFWRCIGEKQYFDGNHESRWSWWGGLYTLEDGTINGKLELDSQTDKK